MFEASQPPSCNNASVLTMATEGRSQATVRLCTEQLPSDGEGWHALDICPATLK